MLRGRSNKGYWSCGVGASGDVAKNLLFSGKINARFNDAGWRKSAHLGPNWSGSWNVSADQDAVSPLHLLQNK